MKHKRECLRLLLPVVMLLAFASGCRSVPFSERPQLMLSGSGHENSRGETAYAEYKQKFRRSSNTEYNEALSRCGQAIKAVAEQDDFEWEFIVLESETANAFCLPGGKVAVYSGIFKFMENEGELAAVVSHEIAHAIARHGGERMSWLYLQSAGLLALSFGLQNETVNSIYGVGTQFGVMLPFSRANETEADLIGLTLMARAGYNPRAAVSFWKKFSADKTQSLLENWTSTHPAGEDRVSALEDNMPQAEEEYRNSSIKRNYGITFTFGN